MSTAPKYGLRRLPSRLLMGAAMILAGTFLCSSEVVIGAARPGHGAAVLELDTKSDFSHIRLRRQGSVRSLLFVRDSGVEVTETMMDRKKPHDLLVAYTRLMFASYLFCPRQEQSLIVGLGGGAMIRFIKRYDPKLRVEAVEIDPAIIRIADRYFDVRSEGNVKITTADGLQFLEKTENRYWVVKMSELPVGGEQT
jgi:spermidine synthase